MMKRKEENQNHAEYKQEYAYYSYIAEGNLEEVKHRMVDTQNEMMYEDAQYGRLSMNRLQNIRYHFVVAVALITRFCVERGLERELAYTLSDLYIAEMDSLKQISQILELQNVMILDFTRKMANLPKKKKYSLHVVKAMEYCKVNCNQKLTVQKIADYLKLNRSYLSNLFIKETGMSISAYIRKEKVKVAMNLLRYTEDSFTGISEYLGFSTQSHFIQCFHKETGYTPKEYRIQFQYEQKLFQ